MTDIPSRPTGSFAPPTLNARIPSRGSAVTLPAVQHGRLPSKAPTPQANPANASWRRRLRMASFKTIPFYVDQQGRSGGRRTVLFEYPKRDMPYAEDMGRQALRYQITGYLIQAPGPGGSTYNGMDSDYDIARDRLENALMSPAPGRLVDPYNPRFFPPYPNDVTNPAQQQGIPTLPGYSPTANLQFYCEKYSIVEQREKGGFCSIEMSFVEAGLPAGTQASVDTVSQVQAAAQALQQQQADAINQAQQQQQSQAPAPPVQVPETVIPPGIAIPF